MNKFIVFGALMAANLSFAVGPNDSITYCDSSTADVVEFSIENGRASVISTTGGRRQVESDIVVLQSEELDKKRLQSLSEVLNTSIVSATGHVIQTTEFVISSNRAGNKFLTIRNSQGDDAIVGTSASCK